MNKELLQEYINLNYSTYKIAQLTERSQTSVRYWMKKYNLKSRYYKQTPEGMSYCRKCDTILPVSNFSVRKNRDNKPFAYCKSCDNKRKANNARAFKQLCLDYKNTSECKKCGYNKNIVALDFHHIDPKSKDFNISKHASKSSLTQSIKEELDKCNVLCANCHREEHDVLN